jgi:hypothetical protein
MASPPNISKHPKGYNKKMFRSDRAVRKGFMILGYGVNTTRHKVTRDTVREFQRDYNKCSDKFGQWGKVEITGELNKDTLNALEHAVRWSKKREDNEGVPSARSWQSLCHKRPSYPGGCGSDEKVVVSRTHEREPYEASYVEIAKNGIAKLKSIDSDIALRAEVVGFERDGAVVFAIVKIPPQSDLPGGRAEPFRCPCVLSR